MSGREGEEGALVSWVVWLRVSKPTHCRQFRYLVIVAAKIHLEFVQCVEGVQIRPHPLLTRAQQSDRGVGWEIENLQCFSSNETRQRRLLHPIPVTVKRERQASQ
jgi:hypothetical protein